MDCKRDIQRLVCERGNLIDTEQRQEMLQLLKTLADENRLTMLMLMGERPRTVTEMAGLLELSEPTVSHHVSKLRGVMLLNLRMDGNQRFYSLNLKRLDEFKQYVSEIEKPPTEPEVEVSDNAWIDALDWPEADKAVLVDYTFNGRLTDIPKQDKQWVVILRWLGTRFEQGRRYTEKEVNAVMTEIYGDYATLRRDMVEFGFMRRERGGGDYWLTPEDEDKT